MLFEPGVSGHHPTYIEYLIRAWQRDVADAELWIAVSSEFPRLHSNIYALGAHERIFFHEIAVRRGVTARLGAGALSGVEGPMLEWFALKRAVQQVGPSACLVMYVDGLLAVPLSLGLRVECPLWGIYFRPSFHYPRLAHAFPGKGRRLRAARQRMAIKAVARWRNLEGLFILDPYAIEPVREVARNAFYAVALADPTPAVPAIDGPRFRAELGIPEGRKVALLFGKLGPRKGAVEVLRALPFLPKEMQHDLCVLLVGQVPRFAAAALHQAIDTARRLSTAQIVLVQDYVAESEVMGYFALCDVVLAAYDEHVGMSGIQVRAAQAGKPILSSNYGLISELTHQFRLGLTAAPKCPRKLACAWEKLLTSPEVYCDAASMAEFARANTVDAFAHTIVSHLA